ncbi:MAG: anaerobic ribonucleoside-triphosphate reductase activating protein [Gammaproteobacteria bacterium]|nr:anaerobic ribonucleoside-triphosphate reductase activating protein [Gammaproteobacteria bacterium]
MRPHAGTGGGLLTACLPAPAAAGNAARAAAALRIGGLVPLTGVDYPGELAAVVFCQGCPWRCRYCHNPHLIPARGAVAIRWEDVERFLETRRGLLDAVVFSGGEPTAQGALVAACRRVRELGFRVGLHTAGACPERLRRLLPHCDWVGLDIKSLPEDYGALTGAAGAAGRAWRSLDLLLESGIRYEVRTTVHSEFASAPGLRRLADALWQRGVRHWALQLCETSRGEARALGSNRWRPADLDSIGPEWRERFDTLALRGAG